MVDAVFEKKDADCYLCYDIFVFWKSQSNFKLQRFETAKEERLRISNETGFEFECFYKESPHLISFIMWGSHRHEEHQGNHHHDIGDQISRTEREMLRNGTSRKDSDAKTQVPGSQVGGSGRAALTVGCQVDEQGVESRETSAETHAAEHGYGEESHRSVAHIPVVHIMAKGQRKHGEHDDNQSDGNSQCDLAIVDHLAGIEARNDETNGINGEEQTAADGKVHLLGIEGDIV